MTMPVGSYCQRCRMQVSDYLTHVDLHHPSPERLYELRRKAELVRNHEPWCALLCGEDGCIHCTCRPIKYGGLVEPDPSRRLGATHVSMPRRTANRLLELVRWMQDHGGGDIRACGEAGCPSCEARDLAQALARLLYPREGDQS